MSIRVKISTSLEIVKVLKNNAIKGRSLDLDYIIESVNDNLEELKLDSVLKNYLIGCYYHSEHYKKGDGLLNLKINSLEKIE